MTLQETPGTPPSPRLENAAIAENVVIAENPGNGCADFSDVALAESERRAISL
jgi:hypothetical protein